MKTFFVEIELDSVEFEVKAKNITEAKKKAIAKLNRKKPQSLIKMVSVRCLSARLDAKNNKP